MTFMEYVAIDSESGQEGQMCQRLCQELTQMGYSFSLFEPLEGHPSDGKSISVYVEGNPQKEGIIFAAHVDTVMPGEDIKAVTCSDGYIRSDSKTVLGADDKSGVAALMEMLRSLKENSIDHCPLQVLFTIQEEIGTLGAQSIPVEKLAFKQAIVLDSSGDVGRVVTSSPGRIEIHSTVIGKAAHAGNMPEKGVSALRVMSRAIENMHLQRIDFETTANIGTFRADGATNIVNERASITAEIRSRNSDKLNKEERHMYKCLSDACTDMGARLEYKIVHESAGYQLSDEAPVVERIKNACATCGYNFFTAASGGGSDANVFNQKGLMAVNIATGMEKVHTTEEQISVDNLEKTAVLLWHLVTQ